jgi:hypothetical protein
VSRRPPGSADRSVVRRMRHLARRARSPVRTRARRLTEVEAGRSLIESSRNTGGPRALGRLGARHSPPGPARSAPAASGQGWPAERYGPRSRNGVHGKGHRLAAGSIPSCVVLVRC